MIPDNTTFKQIQQNLLEAPLFKKGISDSNMNIGIICHAKQELEDKINTVKSICEEDRLILDQIHSAVRTALKCLPKNSKTSLHKELSILRRLAHRSFRELGAPTLNRSIDTSEFFGAEMPVNQLSLLSDIDLECATAPFMRDEDFFDRTEFNQIEALGKEQLVNSGKLRFTLTQGKTKNRHSGILPFGYNQIGGRRKENDNYVNASLINLGSLCFIAAQGPIRKYKKTGALRDDTVPEFINMLKLESNTIVTLTNAKEGEHEKCAPWWDPKLLKEYDGPLAQNIEIDLEYDEDELSDEVKPKNIHPAIWGPNFFFYYKSSKAIEVPENKSNQKITKRRFLLEHNGRQRVVTQFHVENWMDGKHPEIDVLEVLIKRVLQHPVEGPLVVHCSSGVQRTGTFILAYKNYKHVRDKLAQGVSVEEIKVNYLEDTMNMRTQRVKMVGTLHQYKGAKAVVRKLGHTSTTSPS